MPSSTSNQDAILKRYALIKNRKDLADSTHSGEYEAKNCSDNLKLYLKVKGEQIEDASWQGSGCIIFSVATDAFLETIKNTSLKTALTRAQVFIDFIEHSKPLPAALKALQVFNNVREHKNRMSCATAAAKTFLKVNSLN